MIIRKIKESDAERYLDLCRKLDEETDFLLFEPGERESNVEEQRRKIKKLIESDSQIIFVAEKDNELVGFVLAIGGDLKRIRHSAYVVAGILQAHTHQGIGTELFNQLFSWANRQKVCRLELRARTDNSAMLGLCKKLGFEIEGIKKRSVFVKGGFEDSYYMAKLMD